MSALNVLKVIFVCKNNVSCHLLAFLIMRISGNLSYNVPSNFHFWMFLVTIA